MFWDGERWLPDDGRPHAQPQPHAGRRVRDWLATGLIVLLVACLVVPFAGALAARPSARARLAEWSQTSEVKVYQEGSRAITYRGSWALAYYPEYLGGARATDAGKGQLRSVVPPSRGSARSVPPAAGHACTSTATWSRR
jgi:hypothetical protein